MSFYTYAARERFAEDDQQNDSGSLGSLGDEEVEPHDFDVMLGKDKYSFNHVGNVCFRQVVVMGLPAYAEAPNRRRKSDIIRYISSTIARSGGRFVRNGDRPDTWKVVDRRHAREKVGHAIRDALQTRARQQKLPKKKTMTDPAARCLSSDGDLSYRFNWEELVAAERAKRNEALEEKRRMKYNIPTVAERFNIFRMMATDGQAHGLVEDVMPSALLSNKRPFLSEDKTHQQKSPKREYNHLTTSVIARDSSWKPKQEFPSKDSLLENPPEDEPQANSRHTDLPSPSPSPIIFLELKKKFPPNSSSPADQNVDDDISVFGSTHSITSSEEDDDTSNEHAFSNVFRCTQDDSLSQDSSFADCPGILPEALPSLSRVASRDSLLGALHDDCMSPIPFDHHDQGPHHDNGHMWARVATKLESFQDSSY